MGTWDVGLGDPASDAPLRVELPRLVEFALGDSGSGGVVDESAEGLGIGIHLGSSQDAKEGGSGGTLAFHHSGLFNGHSRRFGHF